MQRVVAGTLRGRRLLALPRSITGVRPSSSRVRGAIFDRLQSEVVDARVLDLFAGTGALAIEALSRGAARATLVEQQPALGKFLLQQLDELGLRERATVVTGDALRYLSSRHQAGLGPCSAAPPRAPTPSLRSGPRSGSLAELSSRHRAGLEPCSAAPPRAPTPSLRSGPSSGSLADREESGARPGGGPFDLVLVDPPYGDLELYAAVLTGLVEHKCLAADAVVVIEYEKQRGRRPAIPIPPGLESEAIRDHGQTALEFLRAVP